MITITIAGTDRTRLIQQESLRISRVVTNQPDTCNFQIRKFGDRTYAPTINDEVVVTQDGTKIFAGTILDMEEEYGKLNEISYNVKCVDYRRHMNSKLVIEVYENMTITAIVADIKSKYLPSDVTTTNVNGPTVIKYVAFNYETPTECLRQLAEISDSDWYIDYDKDIHFFPKRSVSSAFSITDQSGNYIYETLKIRKDISQLRNVIYVRGGEYLANTMTAAELGDGVKGNFYLPHKFSNVKVTVTGVEKSVGIDPIDDPGLYDCLHNYNEKVIKFRADRIPRLSGEVRTSGQPNLPVIVKVEEPNSIQTYTAWEHVIIDKSIKSKEGARQRGLAELYSYSATVQEGEFETYIAGLVPGTTIHINSTLRGIDEDFIINRVDAQILGDDAGTTKFIYSVGLMTTKTFDYIRLLQSLINKDKKEIIIDANEILDQITNAFEDMELNDAAVASKSHNPTAEAMTLADAVASEIDAGTEFVAGPWTADPATTDKRQFIMDSSPLG